MKTVRPPLPLFTPSDSLLEGIQVLQRIRSEISCLLEQRDALIRDLDPIPDGVRVRHPSLSHTFYRQRARLLPKVLDINEVPSQFLKPSLERSLVTRHFRETGEEPPGVVIGIQRGSLCFASQRSA